MAQQHQLARLGLVAGLAGGIFILSACSRPGGSTAATATPAVTVRTTTPSTRTPVRTTTTTTAAPSSAPSTSSAPSSAPTPTTAAAPAATAAATKPATSGQKYVVQAGDTLSDIAEKFGVTIQALIDANKLENPNLLLPGQELIIPGQ
jgi:LysM repeat protein